MLSDKKFYLLTILFIVFVIFKSFSGDNGATKEFHDAVFVKKELTQKLQDWKEWKRSWYGRCPVNKPKLFEIENGSWMEARLVNFEIIKIKSSSSNSILTAIDKHSITSIALVKLTLKVNGKIYTRFLEYHLYKVLDTMMGEGVDWLVTESYIYDKDEIKSQIMWSDFFNKENLSLE